MPLQEFDHLSHIPAPSSKRIAIRISRVAEREIRNGHPWLFDQSIQNQSHDGNPGDLAVIFDSKRKFLAVGLFDPFSPIRVRILQHRNPSIIDQNWFKDKLKKASEIRSILPFNTTGFRVIHGENDGFPGIVVDRYENTIVIKIYSTAWIPYLKMILPVLQQIYSSDQIVLRLGRETQTQGDWLFGLADGDVLFGKKISNPIIFSENGIQFEADFINGQKTGFFLDQRENRVRVEKLTKGKSVLNMFAYTGGFSVYAARGGATNITSVDISKPALGAAKRNFEHNQTHPNIAKCQHNIIAGDAFQVLDEFIQQDRRFDLVIIDPPSFAKKQKEIRGAIQNYRRLTQLGIKVLNPDGIFVQASCSSRIDTDTFFQEIHQAAQIIGRPLQEIERTFHAIDHPIAFKEGAYLKCLFARG